MPIAGTSPASEYRCAGWHTSVFDGYSHAITDTAFSEGVHHRRGQFGTVCGLVICLAASVAPCGQPCRRCAALLQTSISLHSPDNIGPHVSRATIT